MASELARARPARPREVLQGLDRYVDPDLVPVAETIDDGPRGTGDPDWHAFCDVGLDAVLESGRGKPAYREPLALEMGSPCLFRERDPNGRGSLGREAVEAQCRQKTDDRVRDAATDESESMVLRDAVAPAGVEPTGQPLDPPLREEGIEPAPGNADGLQVGRAEDPERRDRRELLAIHDSSIMVRNVGGCNQKSTF